MRPTLSAIVIAVSVALPVARAQTAASPPAETRRTVIQPAARQPTAPRPTARQLTATQPSASQPRASQPSATEPAATQSHPSRRASSRHSGSRTVAATAQGNARARKADSVLTLDATDITGNKELPKVMVIVPWKDSLGAGGVVEPTDSLLDQVLQPVDRGVFQREIHYYGQL